ncbi:class I SAM-dependent methyltransferase [Methylobacterium sp. J-070]|uniref:class I SAM-dependent methyltransferase n=1 Tax=Methylobacterium sp. J-070 TaxID=2836650 RepID=UPI001FBA7C6B|nr:class I SAM-dependent methyltransferase [Methylobacterium sp. J-070]MCJ2051367.1 class I SAM-dependent methyltransferase [Methylobacterium sp. J-070]
MSFTEIRQCLACGSEDLHTFLDLGDQPLANSCHRFDEVLQAYPLAVRVCKTCWHCQLSGAVDPSKLFEHYLYVSGTTETLRNYFADFVTKVEGRVGNRPLRVLDIASNDGSLLKLFRNKNHIVQGVDPAKNLECLSISNGVPTKVAYWSEEVAQSFDVKFDVVVAMNVLGHVADPLSFLKACAHAVSSEGRVFIQTSQALMIKNGEFDTIYHEHHSFFCCNSFQKLANRSGLKLVNVEHVPIHGTSYLFELAPQGANDKCEQYFEINHQELQLGYREIATYSRFAERSHAISDHVGDLVRWHRADGYKIVGYGVAAKGMTFLNFSGIELEYIVDDNPLKVGLFTPGTNTEIVGKDTLEHDRDRLLIVILAWNFYPEIVKRIRDARRGKSDRFLTYFPSIRMDS